MKDAACQAICEDVNQYAITWAAKRFRDQIAAKYQRNYGLEIDPEREITVLLRLHGGHDYGATVLAVSNLGVSKVVIFLSCFTKILVSTGITVRCAP